MFSAFAILIIVPISGFMGLFSTFCMVDKERFALLAKASCVIFRAFRRARILLLIVVCWNSISSRISESGLKLLSILKVYIDNNQI